MSFAACRSASSSNSTPRSRRRSTGSGAWGVAGIAAGDIPAGSGNYIQNTVDYLTAGDIVSSLVKGAAFGFIIAVVGCYQGYNAKGGGRGVGLGTTRAVVIASVTVLVTDYFLTQLLLELLSGSKGS